MLKKSFVLPLISVLCLAGCDFKLMDLFNKDQKDPGTNNQTPTNQDGNNNTNDDETKDESNNKFYGGLVKGEKYTGFEFSVSDKEIEKPKTGFADINIYGFNDFHGSVVQTERESGLKLLGSFIKEVSNEDNTLVFDQGDTWQGSFESNYEYGKIVQDVFTEANVSLRTIGNHDFDWGCDRLESLCKIDDEKPYIPTLGANIYNYVDGKTGQIQQTQYGKEYATFVLESGVKVGVVGVIGKNQITTICSQLVENIAFTDHVAKIKEISDFLRTDKKCDVVIASAHEGCDGCAYSGLTDVSSVSKKRYVDLVLNGHEHSKNEVTEDGVKYVQWDSNGITAGKVSLKYDFSNRKVVDNETKVNTYYQKYMKTYYTIDPTISSMVDNYLARVSEVGNKVLSTKFKGEFSEENLSNLMCEAISKKAQSIGENVDFAVCNFPRDTFSGEEMKYNDLYKCFPFDNQIILFEETGYHLSTSISRNFHYREDTSLQLYGPKIHRVAVIDYVALHQNSNREFDYFPISNFSVLKNNDGTTPNYREILCEYLMNNLDKTFTNSDYDSSKPHFSLM